MLDRCDAQFETNNLARQMKAPTTVSQLQLKRLARYLAGSARAVNVLNRPSDEYEQDVATIQVWTDSNWAGDTVSRQSQSSIKLEVDGCPMYSCSRRQLALAHSSGEAEYYAGASGASEAMLVREVLTFAGFRVRSELLMDSAAARGICKREGVGRIRHLSTKVLWVQQLVKRGVLEVSAVAGLLNKADLGAKSLPRRRLVELRESCGLKVIGDQIDESDEQSVSVVAASIGGRNPSVLQALAGLLTAIHGSSDK